MASDRKQINVRVNDDTRALIEQLVPAVSAAIGLEVTFSDLFRLGLLELKGKYLSAAKPAARAKKPAAGE
jgi:hypothetical protein